MSGLQLSNIFVRASPQGWDMARRLQRPSTEAENAPMVFGTRTGAPGVLSAKAETATEGGCRFDAAFLLDVD
jgi:hypothetical protein